MPRLRDDTKYLTLPLLESIKKNYVAFQYILFRCDTVTLR